MKRYWAWCFSICLLLMLLALIFTGQIRQQPRYILPLASVLAFSLCCAAIYNLPYSLTGLGLGICFLPMLGPGVLNLFVSAWLLGFQFQRLRAAESPYAGSPCSERLLVGAFFLLMLGLICSAFLSGGLQSDPLVLASIYHHAGWSGFLQYALRSYSQWNNLPEIAAGYLVSIMLVFALLYCQRREEIYSYLFFGLGAGAILCALVVPVQLAGQHSFFLLNQNDIWRSLGRLSGTFSDPNAFGIMATLLIPTLIYCGGSKFSRQCFILAAILLFCSVPSSGSRTAWLGLGAWVLVILIRRLPSFLGVSTLKSTFILLLCLIFSLTVVGHPKINDYLSTHSKLPGVNRLLKTLNWQECGVMLESRVIYSRIALKMWTQNPLVGVGLGRFLLEQAV